jgi:hypothetical protein
MWDILFWLLWPLDFLFPWWGTNRAYELDDDWRRWVFGLAVLGFLVLLFAGFCFVIAKIL